MFYLKFVIMTYGRRRHPQKILFDPSVASKLKEKIFAVKIIRPPNVTILLQGDKSNSKKQLVI